MAITSSSNKKLLSFGQENRAVRTGVGACCCVVSVGLRHTHREEAPPINFENLTTARRLLVLLIATAFFDL